MITSCILRRLVLVCWSAVALMLLSACIEVEGGVEPPTTPGVLPTIEPPTATSTPSPTPTPVASPAIAPTNPPPVVPTVETRGSALRIGLLDEPIDVLPYHTDAGDERITAPVSELLFPSPMLALNYSYTTTGVLQRMPSFENGDVELLQTQVYLDERGTVALTATDTLTDAYQIAITYRWNPALRWSDGVTVTAEDSLFAYELAQQAALGEEAAKKLRLIERYERVDATTTRAFLKPDLAAATAPITRTVTEIITETVALTTTGTVTPTATQAVTVTTPPGPPTQAVTVTLPPTITQIITPTATQPVTTTDIPTATRTITRTITRTVVADFADIEYMQVFWTPLPRHVLEDIPADTLAQSDFAVQPVSYGPYVIERREPGNIRLQRNPFYAGPLPEPDVVSFIFSPELAELQEGVLDGNLDVVVTDRINAEQLDKLDSERARGNMQVRYVPAPIWEHIDFNMDFTLFQDRRARRAIAHATNRQAMVDKLFRGHVDVLDSWILPQHWAAAPTDTLTLYPYDPDQARVLLADAGLLDANGDGFLEQGIDHDSDGVRESSVPITLTLLTTEGTPLRTEIAEQFQADMADIGLAVTILPTRTQQLFNPDGLLFRRGFELVQFAWITSPDPRGFELWGCTAVPSEINNWTGSNLPGWCDREANQAIISATTSLDFSERREAYIEHQRIFTEELPALPLFQRLTVVMWGTGLRGLRPDPIAPITWNIADWSRE